MQKVSVKFSSAGKFAEMDPREPQFEVEKGDVHECSLSLATLLVKAGRGKIIKTKTEKQKAVDIEKEQAAEKAAAEKAEQKAVETLSAQAKELIDKLGLEADSFDLDTDSASLTAIVKELLDFEAAADKK